MDNDDKPIMVMACECIMREAKEEGGWKLIFVGQPYNPLRQAVDRCNEGKATEADLVALSTVPVFDADAPEHTSGLEIIERR